MAGRQDREGISLTRLFKLFPDDTAARLWLEKQIWPDGPRCPHCGGHNVQCNIKHPSMTHRCRDCDGYPMFSLKTGTVMHSSKLGYQTWAIAIYQAATNLKGISSLKLHRDLGITQKSAWHLMHRIRKAFEADQLQPMAGPVEVDETFIGGKRKNMSNARRKQQKGRGPAGKTVVAGAKDRTTGQVVAHTVEGTDSGTLQGFVYQKVERGAQVFTDEAGAYKGMAKYCHQSVSHSTSEYVKGQVHTNGIESFWALLKRGYVGTFHWLSAKHLDRYVAAFAGRANLRSLDTIAQMAWIAYHLKGRRLRYQDLIA